MPVPGSNGVIGWPDDRLGCQAERVPDRLFTEPSLAEVYDLFCPWDPRGDFGFYLPLVMAAGSVLDVGCGTGMLLRRARAEGHTGRLCGLDPAAAMLAVARAPGGEQIDWVAGDLSSASFDGAFELAVMTGHAFQVLITDAEVRQALLAVRSALAPGGRFAFETRNPEVREWEHWVPANATEVTDASGALIRQEHRVELPVRDELVSFTATYSSPAWPQAEVSRSTLRFLTAARLDAFLAAAGFGVAARFGDWDRSPLRPGSPEIITIATR